VLPEFEFSLGVHVLEPLSDKHYPGNINSVPHHSGTRPDKFLGKTCFDALIEGLRSLSKVPCDAQTCSGDAKTVKISMHRERTTS
jgi:hypothetical protein